MASLLRRSRAAGGCGATWKETGWSGGKTRLRRRWLPRLTVWIGRLEVFVVVVDKIVLVVAGPVDEPVAVGAEHDFTVALQFDELLWR